MLLVKPERKKEWFGIWMDEWMNEEEKEKP